MPSVSKNCDMDQEKTLRFRFEGREFAKKNQVATTIYLSIEKSEVRTIFETERSFILFFSKHLKRQLEQIFRM